MIGFISTSITLSLLITLKYSAIADLHNFHFTVAQALGFSVFTSRLLATDLNTETSASNHYEVFLLFRLQSLWNLGTKNSSGLTPPAYDWLVTALELVRVKSVNQSWCRAPSGAHDQIFITVWQLQSCFCGAPSLKRGRVCLMIESLSAVVSPLS
jgi:hypothetical protein